MAPYSNENIRFTQLVKSLTWITVASVLAIASAAIFAKEPTPVIGQILIGASLGTGQIILLLRAYAHESQAETNREAIAKSSGQAAEKAEAAAETGQQVKDKVDEVEKKIVSPEDLEKMIRNIVAETVSKGK